MVRSMCRLCTPNANANTRSAFRLCQCSPSPPMAIAIVCDGNLQPSGFRCSWLRLQLGRLDSICPVLTHLHLSSTWWRGAQCELFGPCSHVHSAPSYCLTKWPASILSCLIRQQCLRLLATATSHLPRTSKASVFSITAVRCSIQRRAPWSSLYSTLLRACVIGYDDHCPCI